GALTLGLAPQRPEVPVSRVDGREAMEKVVEGGAGAFGLSARVTDFLAAKGIALPERAMTAQWAEDALDPVTEPRDTQEEGADARDGDRDDRQEAARARSDAARVRGGVRSLQGRADASGRGVVGCGDEQDARQSGGASGDRGAGARADRCGGERREDAEGRA